LRAPRGRTGRCAPRRRKPDMANEASARGGSGATAT
jgi:hypothetical protein